MLTFKNINSWIIVYLSQPTIVGQVGTREVCEPILHLFKDRNLVVTRNNVYRLGECDKVWASSGDAQAKLRKYEQHQV